MAGLRRMQFVKTSSLYMIERIRTVDKVEPSILVLRAWIIRILIPINICNLIPINKISLFTAFTTWHCCRLHYCLGTFFWNYLYSNQQVWTSTFFLIFSYLVSSLLFHILEQTDRQTDLPTYQTGQTIVWKF